MFEEFEHDHSRDRQDFTEYQSAKEEFAASFDSRVDQLAEHILHRARQHRGGIPTTSEGFAQIVSSIARAAITLEAISGMVVSCVEEQLRTVRIQTIGAILSLVKSTNPHLTIDIIEHVFGLSKDKEADIARKHGLSRQIVSKRTVKMRRELGQETERKREVAQTYQSNRLEQYAQIREKLQSIRANARPATFASA